MNVFFLYLPAISFVKFRNVACEVSFKLTEDGPAQNVFPSRAAVSKSTYVSSFMAQVAYHKNKVTPQDEIKLILPLEMPITVRFIYVFYRSSY